MSYSTLFPRRDFLKWTTVGGLSFLLPQLEGRASDSKNSRPAKSIITLSLQGGPSQLETWDPHPGTKIGGPTKGINTSISGVQIAEHYARTAEVLSNVSVIRSLVSKEGDHERAAYYLKTGYRPDPTVTHPALGAVLAYERPHESLEIPQHVSICGTEYPATGGYLGAHLDAYKVFQPGEKLRNLESFRKEPERKSRRLENLKFLSQSFRQGRFTLGSETPQQKTVQQALKMMEAEQLAAFKIESEPEAVKQKYGEHEFGRGCLVARRLVETGVRAIEVNLNGFDSHANNFGVHQTKGEILDRALASLIEDLVERDLWQSTILLCVGEFGRTPKVNSLDGRDHWTSGFSCLVGGGGLNNGLVIGATDPEGEKKQPVDPVKIEDLFATLYYQLNIDVTKEYDTPIGRPLAISPGSPLQQLVST